MKKVMHMLLVWFALVSCEESNEGSGSLQTNFSAHLLNGYFITSIAFDNEGTAWIGTFKQGLIKYNSEGITVYNSENSVISDTSVIHDIAVDSKNNVWIGSEALLKYDGTDFVKFNTENTPMPENYVKAIAIDSKDNVWFSSSRFKRGGVVKFDHSDWTVYTPDNSNLPANLVQSIAIDKDDNVWLALSEVVLDAYLVKISGDNWTTYTNDDLGFEPYYFGNIRVNSQNKLYGAIDYSLSSALANDRTQVFTYDGSSAQQLQYDGALTVKFITIDSENNVWCGTHGGYAVYNGRTWRVDDSSFEDSGVFAIEQSPDGGIWIGTGNGVYVNE